MNATRFNKLKLETSYQAEFKSRCLKSRTKKIQTQPKKSLLKISMEVVEETTQLQIIPKLRMYGVEEEIASIFSEIGGEPFNFISLGSVEVRSKLIHEEFSFERFERSNAPSLHES
ncbi:hypothetical protein EIN_530920 [Entamoeba invadens IP1]|uniref:Uncharacterized protein n=1 Tax=Entamoeba invadens IP1 TaxID=370355 RepID=L7FMD3_ENTIV|nr:hypothetical protein EIN_530920 [Entamoeba invadens IP1]ELP88712.1 hypothetical protein EIN_530920 [Entamoeba invadens IP1]|eukprot:XP_004255483.1 hypothetical protein EIN_530920 [Entamoeba invadens IP1]